MPAVAEWNDLLEGLQLGRADHVSDEGIRQLSSLKFLIGLDIDGCQASSEAVKELRQELPDTAIRFTDKAFRIEPKAQIPQGSMDG